MKRFALFALLLLASTSFAAPKKISEYTGVVGGSEFVGSGSDGTHFVQPYNSVPFSGTPSEGMIRTASDGCLYVYHNSAWSILVCAGGAANTSLTPSVAYWDPADGLTSTTTATQTITYTATGSVTLAGSNAVSLVTTGQHFAITGGTCSNGTALTTGQTCTVALSFTYSTGVGTFSDTLRVASSATVTPGDIPLGPVTVTSTDTTPPTLTSATLGTDGTTWTFAYSEAVHAASNAALCNGYAVSMATGGVVTLSYSSGTGTSSVVCTGSPTINSGETVTSGLTYTQGTVQDASNNLLAGFTNQSGKVTNNSTQTGAPPSCKSLVSVSSPNDNWLISNDNYGQKIKNSASSQVCRIDMPIKATGANGVHLELWTTADMSGSQIGGDSSSTTTSTDFTCGTTYSFTWASYPNPTTDYYIHVISEGGGGSLYICNNTNVNSYENSSYDMFRSGVVDTTNGDLAFTLYTYR